jgi:hypothetical protein
VTSNITPLNNLKPERSWSRQEYPEKFQSVGGNRKHLNITMKDAQKNPYLPEKRVAS